MRRQKATKREAGIVSILTVIFFMIFISIIIVGFIAIVSDDNRQTTDNDLSQSALSAARSGVEEGKRILLHCSQQPTPAACTDAVLNSTSCDTFTTANGRAIADDLDIPYVGTTGEVSVADNTAYQQYFTCLTIMRDTPVITSTVSRDYDYVVKLKTAGPYSQLRVTWSKDSGGYAFPSGALAGWTSESGWLQAGVARPSVLRIQFVPFTEGALGDLDVIERDSRTVFVAPCVATLAGGCSTPLEDINALDNRQSSVGVPRTAVPLNYGACTGGVGSYSCSISLTGFLPATSPPVNKTYYARISLVYGQTADVNLAALDAGGNPVNFSNVQPWIDVTGRTNDVFRRVRAQVSHDTGISFPRFALDSAAPICKDMFTTSSAATSTLNCTY